MDVDLRLLGDLILGDYVEISEGLVQEGGHITGFLEDLGICVVVDELEQFVEDTLNSFDFFHVCID